MNKISDQLLSVVRAAIQTTIALHSPIKNPPRLQLITFLGVCSHLSVKAYVCRREFRESGIFGNAKAIPAMLGIPVIGNSGH